MDYELTVLEDYKITVIQQPIFGTVEIYYEGERLRRPFGSHMHYLELKDGRNKIIHAKTTLGLVLELHIDDDVIKVNEELSPMAYFFPMTLIPLFIFGAISGMILSSFGMLLSLWAFRAEVKPIIRVVFACFVVISAYLVYLYIQSLDTLPFI